MKERCRRERRKWIKGADKKRLTESDENQKSLQNNEKGDSKYEKENEGPNYSNGNGVRNAVYGSLWRSAFDRGCCSGN